MFDNSPANPRVAAWQTKNRTARLDWQLAGRERAKRQEPLHLSGCMLYWAEGTKSRNTLELVNADPDLISHFCRFLRECFKLGDERFRIRVAAHQAHELEPAAVQQFWADLLSLPETALIKPVLVPEKAGSGRRRLPYGVCSLRVTKSTPILQHIYGAIQQYAGFDQPDWLDMHW